MFFLAAFGLRRRISVLSKFSRRKLLDIQSISILLSWNLSSGLPSHQHSIRYSIASPHLFPICSPVGVSTTQSWLGLCDSVFVWSLFSFDGIKRLTVWDLCAGLKGNFTDFSECLHNSVIVRWTVIQSGFVWNGALAEKLTASDFFTVVGIGTRRLQHYYSLFI